MDWFSWLSRTGLEPTLVYDYALSFSENELEEEDIPHFDHEFLQSMGISIAKHRLEILKLAKKEKGGKKQIMRLLVAIKKTKKCLVKYIHSLVHHEDSSSGSTILAVPRLNSYSTRWKMAMLKRNKKLMMSKQGRFLITHSGYSSNPLIVEDYVIPEVQDEKDVEDENVEDEKVEEQVKDENSWSSGVEEIKWDAMFQNLKPT